jgi:hypothetical protein
VKHVHMYMLLSLRCGDVILLCSELEGLVQQAETRR